MSLETNRNRAIFPITALSMAFSFFEFCCSPLTRSPLKAGFAMVKIIPPLGTALSGFGERDFDPELAAGAAGRGTGTPASRNPRRAPKGRDRIR
jgi:hypothetical protein